MGLINQTNEDYYDGETGGYRYVSLKDIVNNFMVAYVGDGKLIPQVGRADVLFHAKRGMQEFSYDVSRVEKIQEVEVPSSLTIPMPQDYVDKVKLCWIDNHGVEHIIHNARFTSTPHQAPLQDDSGEYIYDVDGEIIEGESLTKERFSEFEINKFADALRSGAHYTLNEYDVNRELVYGGRYGLNPETAQINGYYVINEAEGTISFSSDLNGKIVNIHYVSDSLGTDAEMKVHKFAEEAIYAHIKHQILSTRLNVPEYQVRRFKKEAFASKRNAKLRLYNLNLKELNQTMKGKSKPLD